ncbi:hypothetical protein HH212_10280 [Massilia forsythiae]|uniref:Lipoprotein n=1 Tax=Massilia forsythiae TaxID=2728020 RepID=A0A7Z2VVR5_9BURK|nr:hypothetical protein [Massilia forsythiae]QJE00361.1 hypothetical protein HH212_10280 [Massilia forsythiae]
MKSSILRAGVALACALGLAACGGSSGDLPLSVTISGVTKDGLVLQNNGGDDLAIGAGVTTATFSKYVSTDDKFKIAVKKDASGKDVLPSNVSSCTITNGEARANYYTYNRAIVSCTINQHDLIVAINGLTGSGLVVLNGSDRKTVNAGATTVTMDKVNEDGPYGVTILQQPSGQTCTVANGSGIVGAVNVTTVSVNCAASA